MLFDLALEIREKVGIRVEFVNMSGGIGIPYKPDQKKVDLAYVGDEIRKKYRAKIRNSGLHPVSIFTECGQGHHRTGRVPGRLGCFTRRRSTRPTSALTRAWRI